jgi:hypothetical protein
MNSNGYNMLRYVILEALVLASVLDLVRVEAYSDVSRLEVTRSLVVAHYTNANASERTRRLLSTGSSLMR